MVRRREGSRVGTVAKHPKAGAGRTHPWSTPPGLARRENPAWPGHGSPPGLRNFCLPRSRGLDLEKGEETKDGRKWLSAGEGVAWQREPYSYTVAEYTTPALPST